MNKCKNNLKRNFSTIPNALIQNDAISDRARFLFCYMASKPDDWQFYQGPLAKGLGYSLETLRKYIEELIRSGWLVREARRSEKGRFDTYDYTLQDVPLWEYTVAEKPQHGKNPKREKLALTKEELKQNKDYIQKHTLTQVNAENEFSAGEKIGDVANEFETYGEPEPISKKEKKKTPPSSAGTPPRPTNIEYQMLEAYAQFMEQKGIPVSRNEKGHVQFDKRAFKSCKEWAVWASGMPNATDTLNDWQQFLEAAWSTGDKWLLANFEPNILYTKRTNIVTAIGSKQAKAKELMKSDGFIENLLGW